MKYAMKNLPLVMIFLASISIVPFGTIWKLDPIPQTVENRKFAELPPFRFEMGMVKKYPKIYTNYFNDHFGFRNTFIKLNFLIRHNLLHESASEQVVLGKDGWLFYAKDGSIEDFRGITRFDEGTLRQMAHFYEFKREYLLKRGIRYILVLAPNKETIYGEWMPDHLFKIRDRSGLDDFVDYLRKHTDVHMIDLREILHENKRREQLFLKTSSSWNDFAAFLAYREIMESVTHSFPEARADSLDAYHIEREKIRGEDLAAMMGGADYLRERDIRLVPKSSRKARRVDYNPSGTFKDPFGMGVDNNGLPRIVVFRDCFFDKIIPFLSEHFQHSRYYWESWNPDTPIGEIIETVRPDIVIEEKVERFLKYPKSP